MSHTVVQIVHGYNAPFLGLAAEYAGVVRSRGHRCVTLFLTGKSDAAIAEQAKADQVLFWDLSVTDLRGLKLGTIRRLRRLLQASEAALVIAQRYKPFYLALLATGPRHGVPVVGVAHAFGVLSGLGRRLLLRAYAPRWRLLGVSGAVANDLRRALPACASQIHALANAVAAHELTSRHYARDEARRLLGLSEEFVFGNVGRLHPDKDQATLIRALARLAPQYPEVVLVLVGGGREEQRYRDLAAALGVADRVRFAGFVADAPLLFKAFDCYVSSSDREPFGIVLAEAMVASVPVISSDCGGAPEVLGDDGIYFKRGDDAELAAQMAAIYQASSEERAAIGSRLERRVQLEFSTAAFRQRALQLPVWPDWF